MNSLRTRQHGTTDTKISELHSHLNMDDSHESDSSPKPHSKKRKRAHPINEELEIKIDAPEPASKKALRRARKRKLVVAVEARKGSPNVESVSGIEENSSKLAASKRSEYGIWVGNLPWSATKADVRSFVTTNTDIADESITRLNMPSPKEAISEAHGQEKFKHYNKGFAYIDFATESELTQALALSEKLLRGRRLLIKNSKNFEGRPEKSKQDALRTAAKLSGKPPSRRVFVGNLAFDVSKEDLQEHFAPCGTVTDVHVATFEDSGKCKGYAWVEFADLDAGEAAVRGWAPYAKETNVPSSGEDDDDEGENEDKDDANRGEEGSDQPKHAKLVKKVRAEKPSNSRKWWVNKLKGRTLRMEFAEDKTVRYQKRFGRDKSARNQHNSTTNITADPEEEKEEDKLGDSATPDKTTISKIIQSPNHQADQAPSQPPTSTKSPAFLKSKPIRTPRKTDARKIKPGAALSAAPRLTGGIVPSQGKKISLI